MAKQEYLTSPPKITTMPPGVPYIVGNEAAERFSYYGMNSILTIFMTKYLLDKMGHLSVMPPAKAEAWYHTFVSALYFLPIFGAILADAVFGKFRVVFWLSIVYCFGHVTLALMGSPVAHAIEPRYLLAIGLLMIAMGAGGIKPCVSTNVGDQFGESNKHLLTRVFNWFYFSINAGSALSTLLIPWLLEPYKAAPDGFIAKLSPSVVEFLESPRLHSPDIAFGLPGVFMAIATFIFWLGRKKFVHIPPVGLRTYGREIFNKETGKILLNILIPVPFVAIFWALWQQNFSSWILQAESMDRHLFGIEWLSSQIQTVNPIFILIMLPLFSYWLYPAVEKVVRLTPLRKIGAGLFVTAASFFLVAMIQTRIDAGAATGHNLAGLGIRDFDRRRNAGFAHASRVLLHPGADQTQIARHVHVFVRGLARQPVHRCGQFLHPKSRRHGEVARNQLLHVFRLGNAGYRSAICHRHSVLQRPYLLAGPSGRSACG